MVRIKDVLKIIGFESIFSNNDWWNNFHIFNKENSAHFCNEDNWFLDRISHLCILNTETFKDQNLNFFDNS